MQCLPKILASLKEPTLLRSRASKSIHPGLGCRQEGTGSIYKRKIDFKLRFEDTPDAPQSQSSSWCFSKNFNVKYLEENNHVGSNGYVRSDVRIDLNDSNELTFDIKKNLETDSTEFYNLAYNYENDCLKAGLVYRREFYTDRDVEASDTIMFNISLFPFGSVSLPTIDRWRQN